MEDLKTFPLQRDRESKPGPVKIPWAIADEAYQAYAQRFGTGQSLERLAERGGFSWGEMDAFLPGWRERVDLLDAEVKRWKKKAEELQAAFDLLDRIPDNLRRQLSNRVDYAGTLEKEVDRLRREYEEPGVRCCRGHLVLLPRKVWDCPLCVRERAKKVETAFLIYAARVLEGMSSEEAGAGREFDAVIEGLAELINERVLAKLREFNEKGKH